MRSGLIEMKLRSETQQLCAARAKALAAAYKAHNNGNVAAADAAWASFKAVDSKAEQAAIVGALRNWRGAHAAARKRHADMWHSGTKSEELRTIVLMKVIFHSEPPRNFYEKHFRLRKALGGDGY